MAIHILALLWMLAGQDPHAQTRLPADATAEAHLGQGYEFEKDDRFANAAAEFEAALALDSHLSRARYQLAVCYFALGRQDDARREFIKVNSATPADPSVVYFLGRLDLVEHNPDSAIREFHSIVANPPFPDTAYYLGSAYLEKGDLASAQKWLERARPLNPRDYRIPDHLARIEKRQGHSAEAEQEYAQAAKLRQNYNQAAQDAVKCSEALEKGEADEAREACERLNQPDDPDLLTVLGMTYGREGHYAEAVEPLRRAAQLDPDSYEIQHNLGLTYFRLKQYPNAQAPLERAVALRPDLFDSNALLGATLFMLQQDLKAYGVLDHAHRLNPADADTAELLFKTATILGAKNHAARNYPEALKYLKAAAELKPQDPQVHARLAVVYGESGDQPHAEIEKQLAEKLAAPQ